MPKCRKRQISKLSNGYLQSIKRKHSMTQLLQDFTMLPSLSSAVKAYRQNFHIQSLLTEIARSHERLSRFKEGNGGKPWKRLSFWKCTLSTF